MDLDELRVFVAVVDRGSLAAAAKALRFPLATLRRRLDELEARMGVKLLERDRHGAVPTGAGLVLMEKARGVLRDVQSMTEHVRQAGAEPSGEVVMAIPPGMPPEVLGSFFQLMTDLSPRVSWRVRSTDDPAGALSGDVHAAVCFGERPPEGPWGAHALLTVPERLLASRAYLDRHGTPARADELPGHRLLLWEGSEGRGDTLPLTGGARLPVVPWLRMTDIFLLRQCAARGSGIAFVPDVPAYSGDEGMLPLLEGEVGGKITCWLLSHAAIAGLPRMRLAFEHVTRLVATLSG